MNKILNNNFYIALMTIITIWALFADDIRLMACPRSFDTYWSYVNAVGMSLFFIELALGSLA